MEFSVQQVLITATKACWDLFPIPFSLGQTVVAGGHTLWLQGQLVMEVCLELDHAGVFTPCLPGPLWVEELVEGRVGIQAS